VHDLARKEKKDCFCWQGPQGKRNIERTTKGYLKRGKHTRRAIRGSEEKWGGGEGGPRGAKYGLGKAQKKPRGQPEKKTKEKRRKGKKNLPKPKNEKRRAKNVSMKK